VPGMASLAGVSRANPEPPVVPSHLHSDLAADSVFNAEGLIVSEEIYYDTYGLMAQLGAKESSSGQEPDRPKISGR
jgi:hypothetical protein